TSNAESIGIPGSGPWVIKRARGAGVPSVSRYDAITLTSSVVFGVVDGFTLTGVTYFRGSGGKADNGRRIKQPSIIVSRIVRPAPCFVIAVRYSRSRHNVHWVK
uniref:Uncharacterized protein n=1 Tax=Romanomermis culicivorax TaxID=13658 RepID=A0A915ICG7_ROMCU